MVLNANCNSVSTKFKTWITNNGFTFSVVKTECVHFHKQRRVFPDPDIRLGGYPIKVVPEAKFLGVIVDKKTVISSIH